jgi:hypothetical protein
LWESAESALNKGIRALRGSGLNVETVLNKTGCSDRDVEMLKYCGWIVERTVKKF